MRRTSDRKRKTALNKQLSMLPFEDHQQWLTEWRQTRNNEIYSTGDAGEKSGNRLIKLTENQDGTFNLCIRLPRPCEAKFGKYVSVSGLVFSYGADVIADAITLRERPNTNGQGSIKRDEKGNEITRVRRNSLAVRLKRDGKSWRIIIQVTSLVPEIENQKPGMVGVDFNDGFLSMADIDGEGNPYRGGLYKIPIPSYGGSSEQRRDAMAKAVLKVVRIAANSGKPIAIEKLNFKKKKLELKELGDGRYARMLSSLSYKLFKQMITTRAHRNGIRVIEMNPAFTSVQGAVKYARQLGTDTHHAAAIVIARRAMRFSERSKPYAGRDLFVRSRHGYITVRAPERCNERHVWSWWGKLTTEIKRAREAHALIRKKERMAKLASSHGSLAEDEKFLDSLLSASVATATA